MVIYAIDACDSVLKELISERVKSAEGAREFAKTFDDDHSSSDEGNIIFPGRAKMKQKRNQNRNRMPCQQCKERKVRVSTLKLECRRETELLTCQFEHSASRAMVNLTLAKGVKNSRLNVLYRSAQLWGHVYVFLI